MSYSYEKKFDVVVVGAGVIGSAIAYFLARDSGGKLKIAVVERNAAGEESSGGAAGMLAAQIETDSAGPFLDLALESRGLFSGLANELKEASGVDVEFLPSGILSAAFNAEEERLLKERLAWQKKAGLDCEWLSAEQTRAKAPFLKTPQGGFWVPGDGQVSSSRLSLALIEGAKKLGVTVFENESCERVDLSGPRAGFLETNLSRFVADKVVFAAGSWTGSLLGGRVPVEPVKGQILIFELPKSWRDTHSWTAPIFCGTTPGPMKIHCYCVPKKDGHAWVGATMEHRGMDKSENPQATQEIANHVGGLFPELSGFPFKGVWTGLRPAAPDQQPLLGAVPGFDNVFVASGHFRNGILLAPVTGKLFSEYFISGKMPERMKPFLPSRFNVPSS